MQETIVVIDDERSVADTMAAILRYAGYSAKAVYSAEDALAEIRAQEPALIISDVIMPGMNGVELSIQVRASWPKVRILLISGNAGTQALVDTAGDFGHLFEVLAKPIPPRQLLAKVASVLDNKNDGTARG
jgi:DNA-binding NtrC family response regulator